MSRFKNKVGALSGSSSGGSSEGALVFVKPADLDRAEFNGVVAEGEFVEAIPNRFDDNKNDFKILADVQFSVTGKDRDGKPYTKLVEPGDTVIVNGAGNLGYGMREVSPGDLCRIIYRGKNEISKGPRKGTLAHSFEVEWGADE